MGEFFIPMRRKIGVLTLVMACVFAAGWVRSQTLADCFVFPPKGRTTEAFQSRSGYLIWTTATIFYFDTASMMHSFEYRILPLSPSVAADPWIQEFNRLRSIGCLFYHDEIERQTEFEKRCRVIPYRSIVIPLTLLSAYLLLSKPRKSNQTTITEPVAEKLV